MRYYCCLNRQVAALKCMGRMGKIVIDSAQVPDALMSGSTATASSSGLVLPVNYLDRDPEQIAASEVLLVLHEGPRSSDSSLLAENIPETQDIPHVPQPSDVSQDFEVIIPCKTSAVDSRPYPASLIPQRLLYHSIPRLCFNVYLTAQRE